MCVICASKKGVRQPTDEEIKTMFRRNSHGAGVMFSDSGDVYIIKGFMEVDDLLRFIHAMDFNSADAVVYHFRISTQAGVNRAMTQPFPITDSLEELREDISKAKLGIAHNGIIQLTSDGNKKYSDTALFIHKYLCHMVRDSEDMKNKEILATLEEMTRSKLALMDGNGHIETVGQFINEDGLLFSNTSYKEPKYCRFTAPISKKYRDMDDIDDLVNYI